ncbi:MAG: hypothetical protein SF066_10655 [Thermoanaerobaculia bacterium]|nr:hypothetical protein [Thermoanaerobaculia bacterium]
MITKRLATAFSLATALVATPAFGAPEAHRVALGSEGEIYSVKSGAYGTLFPGQGLSADADAVLAIEIKNAEGNSRRLLVPSTAGPDVEDVAAIFFDDVSNTLFVLWQSRVNAIHSTLNLVRLEGDRWSSVLEISGNPFGFKSAPQISLTRDSFAVVDKNETRQVERKVLHLIWREDSATGPQAIYTPVILIDGEYIGWNPVHHLDDLVGGSPLPALANPALAAAARMENGAQGRGVVIAFVNSKNAQVASVAIDILPGEIGFVAEQVRAQLVDLGRRNLSHLAEAVRAQLVDLGSRVRLHPAVATLLANEAAEKVLAAKPQDSIESIAQAVRAQLVDLGARVMSGRERPESVVMAVAATGQENPLTNLIRIQPAVQVPSPEIGEGTTAMYLSEMGDNLIVAWRDGKTVSYRESAPASSEGWSTVRTVQLDENLTAEQVDEALARRVRERQR